MRPRACEPDRRLESIARSSNPAPSGSASSPLPARTARGPLPVARRRDLLRCCRSTKPRSAAIRTAGNVEQRSRCCARSSRRRRNQPIAAQPRAARNNRLRWVTEQPPARARSPAVSGSPRRSSAWAMARRTGTGSAAALCVPASASCHSTDHNMAWACCGRSRQQRAACTAWASSAGTPTCINGTGTASPAGWGRKCNQVSMTSPR